MSAYSLSISNSSLSRVAYCALDRSAYMDRGSRSIAIVRIFSITNLLVLYSSEAEVRHARRMQEQWQERLRTSTMRNRERI